MRRIAIASVCLLCLCNGRRISPHMPSEKSEDDSSHEGRDLAQQLASLFAASESTAAFSAPPSSRIIAPTSGKAVALKQRAPSPRSFFEALENIFSGGSPVEDSNFGVYDPDLTRKQATMPIDSRKMISQAVEGTMNALDKKVTSVQIDQVKAMEVVFPFSASTSASLQNPNLLMDSRRANRDFCAALLKKIGNRQTVVVQGAETGVIESGATRTAPAPVDEKIKGLRGAREVVADWEPGGVIIGVAPYDMQDWDDLQKLAREARADLVVCNGKGEAGRLPHSYYFQKLTGMGKQLGGVVRLYPGPYEAYVVQEPNKKLDFVVEVVKQRRKLMPALQTASMVVMGMQGAPR